VHKEQKALIESAGNRAFYFPLVFIDGELRIAGSAEYYEILYAVRQVMGDKVAAQS